MSYHQFQATSLCSTKDLGGNHEMSAEVRQNSTEPSKTQLPSDPDLTPARAFTEAAQHLGIPRRSITRWWEEPTFREIFDRQWDEASPQSASEVRIVMLRSLLLLPEHLASSGTRKLDREFRYVTVSNIETADDEREREALKRFNRFITNARNNRKSSCDSDHRSAPRPWRRSGEAQSHPVLRQPYSRF